MISSTNPATHTEYIGLSTDARPSMAYNGDVFLEMDTGKVFMYDAHSKSWLEF